ncbi:MAG TPA: nitrophenyl compound nitroreductase subunit ArsF family protein [Prolixibacteraceae bacterium]|nr:nitrophenyl compound nitroreductase subunit ArsF family protein [Prolixibacteraceae bacterium]
MIRLLLAVALLVPFFSGNAQSGNKETTVNEKIEAYYFHFTTRCMTCRTVEERAKENLQDLYPELWKSGKLTFQAADLNDKEGEKLAKTLNVSGQTLLLTKGSKQINITNEAFLHAVNNPVKYKSIIKEKVDELLK